MSRPRSFQDPHRLRRRHNRPRATPRSARTTRCQAHEPSTSGHPDPPELESPDGHPQLQAPLASVIRLHWIEVQYARQGAEQSTQLESPAAQLFVVGPLVVDPLHVPQKHEHEQDLGPVLTPPVARRPPVARPPPTEGDPPAGRVLVPPVLSPTPLLPPERIPPVSSTLSSPPSPARLLPASMVQAATAKLSIPNADRRHLLSCFMSSRLQRLPARPRSLPDPCRARPAAIPGWILEPW
jgi:hypothetical protein